MRHKRVLFRAEAREKVLRGAAALADAVRVTLGPRAHCVLIEREWGDGVPLACDDGVTIAREFDLADPEENIGARMLREAAERTGDAVGDGTTTATIIAHALLAEGVRNVTAGASAIALKRGMEHGLEAAVGAVRALARPVEGPREREQVATISAHNDPSVGEMVARAFDRVGCEGVISVEEARGTATAMDVVQGMRLDQGYLSPYFVTDAAKMEAVLEEPYLLLQERRIGTLQDVLPLLEAVAREGKPLLIVAGDVEGDALATLVVNKLRGILNVAAVKAPGFGERRKAMMEDLATLTGGRFLAEEMGVRPEGITLKDLGRARRVAVGRDATTVVGGAGDPKAVEARCAALRRQAAEETSAYDRERLEERLGKLAGGVAVIRVGAPSEAEMKRRKDAFEDAISATRAAIAEGIVPGAGLALLHAIPAVRAAAEALEGDEDARTGARVLAHALEAPARQIAENSGLDGAVVVERMRAGNGGGGGAGEGGAGCRGLDAARGEFVDLYQAGIVDAAKVVRVGLENAVSVAGVLLLAEATMTNLPPPAHAGGPGAGALADGGLGM